MGWSISTWGKVFLTFVVLQTAFLLISAGLILSDDSVLEDQLYCVFGIFSSLFTVYFSFDGINTENVYQIRANLLSSFLIGSYLLWHYSQETINSSHYGFLLAPLAFVSSGCFVSYLLLYYPICKKFGWYYYRKLGSSQELQNVFDCFQAQRSDAIVDVEISLVFGLLVLTYLSEETYMKIVNGLIIFLVVFPLYFFGKQSINDENLDRTNKYIYTFPLYPIFVIAYCIYAVLKQEDGKYTIVQFIFLGCISLLGRALLWHRTRRCIKYFGLGLKEKMEGQGNGSEVAGIPDADSDAGSVQKNSLGEPIVAEKKKPSAYSWSLGGKSKPKDLASYGSTQSNL